MSTDLIHRLGIIRAKLEMQGLYTQVHVIEEAIEFIQHAIQVEDQLQPLSTEEVFQLERPQNCRNRLRDEGQVYPKSGCDHCKNGGLMGCPYERNKGK